MKSLAQNNYKSWTYERTTRGTLVLSSFSFRYLVTLISKENLERVELDGDSENFLGDRFLLIVGCDSLRESARFYARATKFNQYDS